MRVLFFSVIGSALALVAVACGSSDSDGSNPNGASDSGAGDSATAADGAMSGDGGDGDGAAADAGPLGPVLLKTGVAGKVLLQGVVITPDDAFEGEVLVEGDIITCVDVSCASSAGAAAASIVQTHGVILPGMINAHDHVLYDIMDPTDWSPTSAYTSHDDWSTEPRYTAMIDAKQYLNKETSTVDLNCELDKYGELKGLIAGTTSIVGAANPADHVCYGTLARTIDQLPNGLGADKITIASLFPDTAAADGVCADLASNVKDAYLVHVAEGTAGSALTEFTKLGTVSTTDGCLYNPKTTIVHGTALTDADFTVMATNSMGLVWSPRSDVNLYGGGTDLTKTTNVALAISKGINVSIGTNWSMTGSPNMLEELRFADMVDNAAGNVLSPKMLVQMATRNAAKNLGLSTTLGSLAVGMKADILVVSGNTALPYDAVLAARPQDVQLVMVGGAVLVGAPVLQPIAQASPACEMLDVCGTSKLACVAAPGGTSANKIGQTFADIVLALSDGITAYDALNLTAFKFAPITPVVHCE